MPFQVKNITRYDVPILGTNVEPNDVINLFETNSIDDVRNSLLTGELYDKIMGRMIALVSPGTQWDELGLSDDEFSFLCHAGIFRGYQGVDVLQPPFKFDPVGGGLVTNFDGYISVGTVDTNIRGDDPIVSQRDNVLIAGTDTGAKGGTVRFGKIDASNQLAVGDTTSQASLASIDGKLPDLGENVLSGSIPVNIVRDQLDGYVAQQIADVTNAAVGVYDYYIDMWGWRYVGFWIALGANSTAKIYTSGEFNVSAASAGYIDSTCYLFRIPTLGSSEKHLLNLDTVYPFRWIKIEVNVTAVTNNHGIWIQQMKAL